MNVYNETSFLVPICFKLYPYRCNSLQPVNVISINSLAERPAQKLVKLPDIAKVPNAAIFRFILGLTLGAKNQIAFLLSETLSERFHYAHYAVFINFRFTILHMSIRTSRT